MMMNGVNVEQVVTAAAARAGYSPTFVPIIINRMIIHLMTMDDVTPERVNALATELIPGIMETFIDETLARLTPISEAIH